MQTSLCFENEGQLIAGTLHIPEGEGPWPGVIFCHGFSGHRIETHFIFVTAARRLAERGFVSLRFDFRGSGESEGEFVDMTTSAEISDARQALDVLAQRPEVDPARLGVVGISLGGLVAASTAAREPRIKSAILWAAVADLPTVLNAKRAADSDKEIASQGWTNLGGLKLGREFLEDMMTLKPADELADADCAVLIIQGTDDDTVAPEQAETYFAKTQRPGRKVKKLIIDGGDHTFGRADWTDTVISETGDWLEKTL